MCAAYASSRYGEMFKILGSGPAIAKHEDKANWRRDMDALQKLRAEGTIGQIVDFFALNQTTVAPDRVLRSEEELKALDGTPIPEESSALQRYSKLRDVPYREVIEVVKFIEKQTSFATQHSVKGAEFENVLVVLGGGWNHYNWPQLLELIHTKALNAKNTKGFYRARNLFYVSISRPMNRLAVLATQTLPDPALEAVKHLFGAGNVEALEVMI